MHRPEDNQIAISLQFADVAEFVREAARREGQFEVSEPAPPFYRVALGLVPLNLGEVEFRILMLLASKPYRPFSRERIAEGATNDRLAVIESQVDDWINSLRGQLGPFRDYVQSVPYLGYRFKP